MMMQRHTENAAEHDAAQSSGGGDPADHRPVADRFLHAAFSASALGLSVSIALHVALGLFAAGIVVAPSIIGVRGPGDSLAATVDLEMATEVELAELSRVDITVGAAPSEELPEFAAPDIEIPQAGIPGADSEGGVGDLSSMGGAGFGGGSGSSDGVGAGFADGSGLGGAGSGSTSFFGVEARGSRFVYIVDISGSMTSGGKIQALQYELLESVGALVPQASFAIIMYNQNAIPLGARVRWNDATESRKRAFDSLIRSIQSGGSTDPYPAFTMAFSLRPPPDAIYFMTDGIIGDRELPERVMALNRQSGSLSPIHCISFVDRAGEPMLRQIATESDGSYTYVPGPAP